MSIPKHLRRLLLLNWSGLMLGCLVSYLLFDWALMIFLGSLIGAFGLGVMITAHALAEDFNTLQREVDRQREVNRKIVERAKR